MILSLFNTWWSNDSCCFRWYDVNKTKNNRYIRNIKLLISYVGYNLTSKDEPTFYISWMFSSSGKNKGISKSSQPESDFYSWALLSPPKQSISFWIYVRGPAFLPLLQAQQELMFWNRVGWTTVVHKFYWCPRNDAFIVVISSMETRRRHRGHIRWVRRVGNHRCVFSLPKIAAH
jgi:hypothetical protein